MTFGQVRGWAFGLLHIPRSEFYLRRPGEFWEALEAHIQEKDADRRHIGELVRGATMLLFNLQLKKSDRISDPVKFWPMPWDHTEEDEVRRLNSLSDEERQKELTKFLERIDGTK